VLWYALTRPNPHQLKFSGRLEGYESDIGAKVGGRVQEVTVREGASVKRGEVLARLDDDELQAQLKGAQAQIKAAQQQEENARLQINVLQSQIAEARLRLQQSQGQTQGQVFQSEAQLAAAQAQLNQAQAGVVQAQANLAQARVDRDRFVSLAREGVVAQQRADQAETAFRTAAATLRSQQAAAVAAQRQVNAAQGALTQSRTTGLNPEINTAQIARLNTQLQQAQASLQAAQADVNRTRASVQQIQASLGNLTVVSPTNGVVTTRNVEPGVVVAPGRTLLSVLDQDTVYMRGFIPAGDIGRVRVGQPAQVFLDSAPDRPLSAKVASIDAQASFTPENIYFREDRVQQVFGVRLTIDHPGGYAKPGMPVDGEIVFDSHSQ
jgi:HlyD family secretion protein